MVSIVWAVLVAATAETIQRFKVWVILLILIHSICITLSSRRNSPATANETICATANVTNNTNFMSDKSAPFGSELKTLTATCSLNSKRIYSSLFATNSTWHRNSRPVITMRQSARAHLIAILNGTLLACRGGCIAHYYLRWKTFWAAINSRQFSCQLTRR